MNHIDLGMTGCDWLRCSESAPDGLAGVGLDGPGAVQVVVVRSRVPGGQDAAGDGPCDVSSTLG